MLSNHIFGNHPRSDSRARESKTAPQSKWRTSMMSMKNPESARCPNPQAGHGQD
jgi:hypothetical protein